MLLFHGTRATALDEILADGLKPPRPGDSSHDWVWDLTAGRKGVLSFSALSLSRERAEIPSHLRWAGQSRVYELAKQAISSWWTYHLMRST